MCGPPDRKIGGAALLSERQNVIDLPVRARHAEVAHVVDPRATGVNEPDFILPFGEDDGDEIAEISTYVPRLFHEILGEEGDGVGADEHGFEEREGEGGGGRGRRGADLAGEELARGVFAHGGVAGAIAELELGDDGRARGEDLAVGAGEHFARAGEDAEGAVALEEEIVARRGEGGVFEGIGEIDEVGARFVFEEELHLALEIEGHARAGNGGLAHDAHGGVLAEVVVAVDGDALAGEIECDAGRGRGEEGFVEAELHGQKAAGGDLAEGAVGRELGRALEAVNHSELCAAHGQHGGAVG